MSVLSLDVSANTTESGECPLSPTTPPAAPICNLFQQPLILSVNCNGLLSKIDEIRSILCATDPDVLAIQETKLDSSISDSEVSVCGYTIFRKDRSRNSGGILLYIRTTLKPKPLKLGIATGLLLIAADVTFRNRSIICATAYRSPGQPVHLRNNFLSNLQDLLASLRNRVYKLGEPPVLSYSRFIRAILLACPVLFSPFILKGTVLLVDLRYCNNKST